jgi:hypothetical protein
MSRITRPRADRTHTICSYAESALRIVALRNTHGTPLYENMVHKSVFAQRQPDPPTLTTISCCDRSRPGSGRSRHGSRIDHGASPTRRPNPLPRTQDSAPEMLSPVWIPAARPRLLKPALYAPHGRVGPVGFAGEDRGVGWVEEDERGEEHEGVTVAAAPS